MPYYCTVPRCTSMAGKAKNVSFHQFPRDEELARIWNNILKRGKPYTKYSKVCSLHFRAEDYTITSVGKNKGQWRTLRKDAIPSRNLPSESPVPPTPRGHTAGPWLPSNLAAKASDPQLQHQMAQAIYLQTMLAMQAAANGPPTVPAQNSTPAHCSYLSLTEIERLLTKPIQQKLSEQHRKPNSEPQNQPGNKTSYKCEECSKCFKDPDVFVLHRRSHANNYRQERLPDKENENCHSNREYSSQDTLRANPILANLLKSSGNPIPEMSNGFDTNSILTIDNQIMTALAANMESYFRNLLTSHSNSSTNGQDCSSDEQSENSNDGQHCVSSASDQNNYVQNQRHSECDQNSLDTGSVEKARQSVHNSPQDGHSPNSPQYDDNLPHDGQISPRNGQNLSKYAYDLQQNVKKARYFRPDDRNSPQDIINSTKYTHYSPLYDQHVPQDCRNLTQNDQNWLQNNDNMPQDGRNSPQDDHNSTQDGEPLHEYRNNVIQNTRTHNLPQNAHKSPQYDQNSPQYGQNDQRSESPGSVEDEEEPTCDNQDLDESKDSHNVVVNEDL